MNRQNYYYRQKVTEADLDNLENNLESALKNSIIDLFGVGMVAGGDVQQNTTPDMSVIVTPGKGYDFLGQRIAWSTSQNVDCSKDKDGNSTAVTTQGNEKWITVLAYFTRFYSDPRVDGHGNIVYFREDEGYTFKVIQGAEAPAGQAQKPAHPTDGGLILADIKLSYGTTAITNSMIDKSRYERIVTHTADEIKVTDPQNRFTASDVENVLAEIDQALDNHTALTTTAHGGLVPSSDVVTSPQANKILKLDSQGKLPTSITGDADTVDGKHASDFVPSSHVGATGPAHGLATSSVAGFMSPSDKAKLDAIQAGAEVNQNAFSQIKIGATTIDADSKTDTLELVAGSGITLTPDAANDKVTFAVAMDDTVHGNRGGGSLHATATASAAGFMSAADKSKLDGIQAGAEVNQNAFSQIKIGTTTIDADSKTDVLELAAGDGITIVPDPVNDKVTFAVSMNDTVHGNRGGGSLHAVATTSSAGFMSASDKAKLDGIQSGAEVNQNAFSNVAVVDSAGNPKTGSPCAADSKTDTLTLKEGAGITLTVDSATDTITIAVTSSAPTAHASTHITGGSDVIPNAVANGASGLMSGADKAKLDSIQAGAEVNQNAFSQIKIGTTTIDADSKTDVLELVAGANISITPDATNDKITIAGTGTWPDADKVDGLHASQFLRSDADSTMTKKLHFSDTSTNPKITAYSVADAATYTILDKDAKVWRAVYNDLAEFMPKAGDVEPGDVLAWVDGGVRKAAKKGDRLVVGVYSDTYGFLLGGKEFLNSDDNLERYAPVAISGRVLVKAVGPVEPGDLLQASDVPGYAEASREYLPGTIIGKALEGLAEGEMRRIWMLVMNR